MSKIVRTVKNDEVSVEIYWYIREILEDKLGASSILDLFLCVDTRDVQKYKQARTVKIDKINILIKFYLMKLERDLHVC